MGSGIFDSFYYHYHYYHHHYHHLSIYQGKSGP